MANRIGMIVAREIQKALPATIFFFLLFHLIALTKAISLDDYSITALRAVGATIAALIIAKAILVVDALPIARLSSGRRIFHVGWKTLLYGVVALLFRLVEEVISLMSKHGDLVSGAKAMYQEVSWPLFAVLSLWIFGGLFLYCLAAELADAVGKERVKEFLFGLKNSE